MRDINPKDLASRDPGGFLSAVSSMHKLPCVFDVTVMAIVFFLASPKQVLIRDQWSRIFEIWTLLVYFRPLVIKIRHTQVHKYM